MKKVLISLLVLAVAGGGAFAQGWTFNGMMAGGIGLFFFDDDDEDARVAPINDDPAAAFRTQLDAHFTNADANAGLSFRIRGNGNQLSRGAGANDAMDAWFDWAFGWLSFADNMVTVYGGHIFQSTFNAFDRMFGFRHMEGLGLLTVVRPMDGLALGFGGFSSGAGNLTLDGNNDEQARFMFSARYDDPSGDFSVVASVRNTNDHVGVAGTGPGWAPDPIPGSRTQVSQAYLSFAWHALEDIHLAATARFMGLEEFADYGDMRFYVTFGHTGLVENMDLRLGASFGMTMRDEMADESDPSPHVWIWASVAYELTDRLVPRLDVHYVLGGAWNNWQRTHHWAARDGATFHEDDSFIQIRPAVQFRATPSAFLEIGCIFNIDLGDNTTWGRMRAGDDFGNDTGMNIGIYALMRVSF